MSHTNEYHLAINDFRIGESQGILFLGDALVNDDPDVLSALKKPILRGSDFSHPWGEIFTPKKGEEVRLRVYGSEFTKKLFIAYAQEKQRRGVRFGYDEKMSGLKLKLWDESFHSRFSRFLKLKEKYPSGIGECRDVPVQLVCNCAGKKAARLAERIEETFKNYCQLFNLSVSCAVIKDEGEASSTSVAICDDESSNVFKIAISDCRQNKKFKSNRPKDRILFLIDERGKENNVLNPRGSLDDDNYDYEEWYKWSFNDEEVLVATIVSYIESYRLAPLFTKMWRDFGEQKLHSMDLPDRAEWYSLTRVFPFVVEEVPKDAVIGNEFNVNVLSFGCDLDENDALTLEGYELASIKFDEPKIVSNQIYIAQAVARCDQPAEIQCRNNIFFKNKGKCDYIQVAMDKNCMNTIVIHKYDCKDECQNQIINVKNHNLTTDCKAFVNGYEFRGDPIWASIGGAYWLECKPFNEFDPNREPDDLSECHWRCDGVEVMDIREGNVKIRKDALVAAPTERCLVKYEIYCGDRYLKSVSIDAVPRVKRMEVKATILGETVGSTIGKEANIECFQGQKIDLSVAIHTSDNKLPMFIPGLTVVFPDGSKKEDRKVTVMDLSVCFKNPGKRKIEVMALDDTNVKQVINFNIKEENSDKYLLCMFIGVLLAWLFFILNYGLGLWTFLSYLVPAVCYWRYKMKQCRFYRKIMMGLFIADIAMFIWSFIQEIA